MGGDVVGLVAENPANRFYVRQAVEPAGMTKTAVSKHVGRLHGTLLPRAFEIESPESYHHAVIQPRVQRADVLRFRRVIEERCDGVDLWQAQLETLDVASLAEAVHELSIRFLTNSHVNVFLRTCWCQSKRSIAGILAKIPLLCRASCAIFFWPD